MGRPRINLLTGGLEGKSEGEMPSMPGAEQRFDSSATNRGKKIA